jgi:hypothetical protein
LLLNQIDFNANVRAELAELTNKIPSFRKFCSEMSCSYDKHGKFDVSEQLLSPQNGRRWLVFDHHQLFCPLDLSWICHSAIVLEP